MSHKHHHVLTRLVFWLQQLVGESYRAASAGIFICNHNKPVSNLTPAFCCHSCLMGWICRSLTLDLLCASALLDGHQSLADGVRPGLPVLSGRHAVHQRGRRHLEGVGAVARQQGRGELGGASDVQHLRQADLLQEVRGIPSNRFYILPDIFPHRRFSNLVVFGAALILEQGDAFPVQDPVMTFSLSNKTESSYTKYRHSAHY